MYIVYIDWKRPWLYISCKDRRWLSVYSCVVSFLSKTFISFFATVILVFLLVKCWKKWLHFWSQRRELLNLSITGILTWTILCCPVYCGMLRSILHLYFLISIAHPHPKLWQLKYISTHCHISLRRRAGKIATGWEPLKYKHQIKRMYNS